jgi:hypothetical protein
MERILIALALCASLSALVVGATGTASKDKHDRGSPLLCSVSQPGRAMEQEFC